MTAAAVNLEIYQGDEVNQALRFRSDLDDPASYVDLTGYTFRSEIRVKPADEDPVAVFTVTVASPQSGATKGRIDLNLDDSVTALLSAAVLRYDVKATPPGGEPTTWVDGFIRVRAQVTR